MRTVFIACLLVALARAQVDTARVRTSRGPLTALCPGTGIPVRTHLGAHLE